MRQKGQRWSFRACWARQLAHISWPHFKAALESIFSKQMRQVVDSVGVGRGHGTKMGTRFSLRRGWVRRVSVPTRTRRLRRPPLCDGPWGVCVLIGCMQSSRSVGRVKPTGVSILGEGYLKLLAYVRATDAGHFYGGRDDSWSSLAMASDVPPNPYSIRYVKHRHGASQFTAYTLPETPHVVRTPAYRGKRETRSGC